MTAWQRLTGARGRRRQRKIAEEKARREGVERLRSYRTPVQACPRGCGFKEVARRDLVLQSHRGRAEATAHFEFETRNCPQCGATLTSRCARCKEEIVSPLVDLCRFCGLPHPWASERRAGSDRASIRMWREEKGAGAKKNRKRAKTLVNDPAERLFRVRRKNGKKGKRKTVADVWAIDGEIAQLEVDAVISNDDVYGQMWSQAARAIKSAAGEGVERLAQEGKPFRLGHAWVTTAGNLPKMKGIIHIASTDRSGLSNVDTAGECLAAALKIATEKKYRSVGVSAFGTGPAGIEQEDWFEMFAKETVNFLTGTGKPKKDGSNPLSIVLVLFEPTDYAAEVRRLRQALYEAWCEIGSPRSGVPDWPPRDENAGEDLSS